MATGAGETLKSGYLFKLSEFNAVLLSIDSGACVTGQCVKLHVIGWNPNLILYVWMQ